MLLWTFVAAAAVSCRRRRGAAAAEPFAEVGVYPAIHLPPRTHTRCRTAILAISGLWLLHPAVLYHDTLGLVRQKKWHCKSTL